MQFAYEEVDRVNVNQVKVDALMTSGWLFYTYSVICKRHTIYKA